MNHFLKLRFQEIERQYNPGHDMPEGIQVSWVEYALMQSIEKLYEKVEYLEAENKRLNDYFEVQEKGK